MIASIHQPSYFPWLGLLHKVNSSDTFIVLDNVQLSDSAYQNRNIFLTNSGQIKYLTIPFIKKDYMRKDFKDLEIADFLWKKKHLNFLLNNYKKHPFFDEIFPLIQSVYEKEYKYLLDLLIDTMSISFDLFGIKVKTIMASELALNRGSKKEDMIIEILKHTGATTYLSGKGAKVYQVEENFAKNGIGLIYQEFTHPTYQQYNNDSFEYGLACIDVAFNLGKDSCSKLLVNKI